MSTKLLFLLRGLQINSPELFSWVHYACITCPVANQVKQRQNCTMLT